MRVLIAARLSSKQKDGRDGAGLDTQDEYAQRWAAEQGHQVVATAADTKTGTSHMWARKNLAPWVTDPAKMAAYDALVAFKSDRLSRAAWDDEVQIRQWAKKNGKELFIVSPSLHWPPANQAEQLSWEIFASQARAEWEAIQERNVRAQRRLREAGALHGKGTFGYAVTGETYAKTLVPTGLGREIVPAVYERVARGDTLASVALWLAAAGIPTAQGNAWSANRVAAVIRCQTYKGRRPQRDRTSGKVVVMTCEPLVDTSLWRQANDNLAARKSTARGKGRAESADRALLASVLRCPGCQAPMYRVWCGTAMARSAYYRCHGAGAVPRSACRNMVSVEVADALAARVISNLDAPVMEPRQVPADDHKAGIEKVLDQLADLPRLGLADEDEDAERARLRAERKALEALPATPARTEWTATGQTYAAQWAALDPAGRGDWLRRRGLKFWAARTDRGLCQAMHRPLVMGLDYTASWAGEADGVSLVATWAGTGAYAAVELED